VKRQPSKEVLRDLLEGKLDWARIKQIMSLPKDTDRFQKYIALAQERVRWPEKILLPLGEHLYIVASNGQRIVKCDCGRAFGDWRRNWKLSALIYARNTRTSLKEIFPGPRCPDSDWCEIREFYCPGCGALLEVESVPPGYPVSFDFLPDLDALYAKWIGAPLPDKIPALDHSSLVTREWARKPRHTRRTKGAKNARHSGSRKLERT
jgi:acetone carboxylase gamma subunit